VVRANEEASACPKRAYGALGRLLRVRLGPAGDRGAFHRDSGTRTAPRCRVHASSFPAFHKSTQVDFCDGFLQWFVSIVLVWPDMISA